MTTKHEYQTESPNRLKEKQLKIKLSISQNSQMYIVHKAVIKQLHERRQGSANCKTRSDVRGGGKKPWKQKGTGKARAGSIRSPLWRGGGVIFGPKVKKYSRKVNKKELNLAIKSILHNKRDFIITIDQSLLKLNESKTKVFLQNIKTLNIDPTDKLLIIMAKKHPNICFATRNLNNIEVIAADQLNPLSIIKSKYILVETDAIKTITEKYNE